MSNLRVLPKIRDNISFAYFEHCRIEQEAKGIAIFQKEDKYSVPCSNIATLMLGPGTSITHAAIANLAKASCTVQWVGEGAMRFYACGLGGTSNTQRLHHQAQSWADPKQHLEVVRRMYEFRFQKQLNGNLTLQQIRGMEGVRVRTVYGRLSKATGLEWKGRDYKSDSWDTSDPINRALSTANSCLYGVCQAAVTAVGYSPALGFVHTGKPLSFVYDIADLYKAETTIPAAFEAVSEDGLEFEKLIRKKCREKFNSYRLMRRIVQDVDRVMNFGTPEESEAVNLLWDDQIEWVDGGKNWAEGT